MRDNLLQALDNKQSPNPSETEIPSTSQDINLTKNCTIKNKIIFTNEFEEVEHIELFKEHIKILNNIRNINDYNNICDENKKKIAHFIL